MSCSDTPGANPRGASSSLGRRALALLSLGFALSLCAWTTSSAAGENELLVIVHPSNPSTQMERGELRPIFQTIRKTWPSGGRIDPVNLPEGSSQREHFDRVVLGFSPDDTVRFWIDRKVRGDARPPRKLTNPSAVLSYVASTPSAIGYVPRGLPLSGVRVVARVTASEVRGP